MPIASRDALWLARVDADHTTGLRAADALSELARFYDTHLILGDRNGKEWWAVHPLIADQVRAQARADAPPDDKPDDKPADKPDEPA